MDSRDGGVAGVSGISVASFKSEAPSVARIATLDSLREHLQWAIELEHFTLPPYLCALYSLDAVRNPEASEVVASVLVEEMPQARPSNTSASSHPPRSWTGSEHSACNSGDRLARFTQP
jgi:Ferritin-like